jgi:hypothetical protein
LGLRLKVFQRKTLIGTVATFIVISKQWEIHSCQGQDWFIFLKENQSVLLIKRWLKKNL